MINIVLVALVAYLIGSVSFSVIFTKKFKGFDVREKGSKSAGSTNVLRTAGVKVALLTLVCDILKGVVAVLFGLLIGVLTKSDVITKAHLIEVAGVFAVIGHTFPIFFGFHGGKGVATSLGVLLIINWKIGLTCLIFALAFMLISRMVSLGSIAAAVLFPVLCIFMKESFMVGGDGTKFSYLIFGIIMAVIVIFNHRANIKRIMNGSENKLSFKK